MIDWDTIGAIGEILGAFAVLVTVIYLSRQVKHSNDLSRFNTVRDLMDKFDNLNGRVVEDSALRSALMKEGPLSAEEEEQVYTFANMFCNTWLSCEYAFNNGLIDEDLYFGYKEDVAVEVNRWPNFGRFVKRWLDTYPASTNREIFSEVA